MHLIDKQKGRQEYLLPAFLPDSNRKIGCLFLGLLFHFIPAGTHSRTGARYGGSHPGLSMGRNTLMLDWIHDLDGINR